LHPQQRDRALKELGTNNKREAEKIISAENEARHAPALNLELAKAYLRGTNPAMTTRTRDSAMDELSSHGKEQSQVGAIFTREAGNSTIRDTETANSRTDKMRTFLWKAIWYSIL
jgi:hypothetical protein